MALFNRKKKSNILDPIHPTLTPAVWDDPGGDQPTLKTQHRKWIYTTVYDVLDKAGYENMENWLRLVFTGSLTTYQYSDRSDVDLSLFVDSKVFPEWSRAEMIGLFVEQMDDKKLPGTPHPIQCFVQPGSVKPEDIFKPGLRSGYDLQSETWLVPPDRNRVHNIKTEMHDVYTFALETADKMDRLLKYEPYKAGMYWHQLHNRRRQDQLAGKGDFSPSNIAYKYVVNSGMIPRIEQVLGEKIAL